MPEYYSDGVFFERVGLKTPHDLMLDHVGFSKNPPNAHSIHDRRDTHILHYVEYGRGFFTCMGEEYPLSGGDLYLFPKNTDVAYRADQNDPWMVHYIGFYGELDDYYMQLLGLSATQIRLRVPNGPAIAELFKRTMAAAKERQASHTLLLGYFYQILGTLLSAMDIPEDKARHPDLFESVSHYIAINLRHPMNVANLAGIFHISQSQLFRIFKAHCGLSPHQYIEKARIDFACTLLRQSDQPMNAVAACCGYEYASHFNKAFQKVMGMSPTAFKRKAGIKPERELISDEGS